MTNALLISTDPYVISEMQKIAGVTGAHLEVTHEPEPQQFRNATHIFVDAQSQQPISSSDPIWVVVPGPAGPEAWKRATQIRAEQIVSLPEDRAMITQALAIAKPRQATVTSIVGLGNGVGASTLACHVAASLSREQDDVVLVDTHLSAGGIEILLGREQEPGLDWAGAIEMLQNAQRTIANQLPRWNELTYVASPISMAKEFGQSHYELLDMVMHDFRHVVIDIDSSGNFDEVISHSDNVCLLVPNTLRSIAIAKNHIAQLEMTNCNVGLVVRDIPGSAIAPLLVAQSLDISLWSALPTDARVVELMEQGLGPIPIRSGSFNRSVTSITARLTNEEYGLRAA